MKQEYSSNEKQKLFEKIAPFLGGSSPDLPTYQQVAQELEMTESAVKVNVHRMRKQFRKLLRDEISNTVASEQEIDQERFSMDWPTTCSSNNNNNRPTKQRQLTNSILCDRE